MPKLLDLPSNYNEQITFLEKSFQEVYGREFYEFIFPDNEASGELNTDCSKGNAVYLFKNKIENRSYRRRIMLKDTWAEDFKKNVKDRGATLCGGLAYLGSSNKMDKAFSINALVFDLDGVGAKEIALLFNLFDRDPNFIRTLPKPTFVACSGSGLHLYYVFQKPILLNSLIRDQFENLKKNLTDRMWNYKATSQQETIQYQYIGQGFRMVGSRNAKYKENPLVRAFKIGDRVSLDYLNQYVDEPENRVDLNIAFDSSKLTRSKAKELYPEWYQKKVIEKDPKPKRWPVQKGHKGDELYEWWKRQVKHTSGGKRYFFLMAMAIYASKCRVPKARLKRDMIEMLDSLNLFWNNGDEVTIKDVNDALKAYDKEYYNFKRADIAGLTGVPIPENKRNKRKQSAHLKLARGQLAQLKELGEASQGRPSKEMLVQDYIKNHPNESVTEVARALNVDRKTVYKYR